MTAIEDSKMNLVYKLEGPAVDEGIDVFKLSPLLLALGKLIQEGQRVAHPEGHNLSVDIKPFQEGSFIIQLAMHAYESAQPLLDMVNSNPAMEVKELIEWLGIAQSAGGSLGVIGLYKFLNGSPAKEVEELNDGDIGVTNKDGQQAVVKQQAFALFQNGDVQQNVYQVYGNFLGQEGVEQVTSSYDGQEDSQVLVTKEDAGVFNPANALIEQVPENEQKIITQPYLNPKRGSFEGESNSWSFRKGDDVLTATIRDQDFLDKISSNEIRLASNDLLKVNLVETQKVERSGEVNSKYEITKIIEYKKAPVQNHLFNRQEN